MPGTCCSTIATAWCRTFCVTAATGTAERYAALVLLAEAPHATTVAADKPFDVPAFVAAVRARGIMPACRASFQSTNSAHPLFEHPSKREPRVSTLSWDLTNHASLTQRVTEDAWLFSERERECRLPSSTAE